MKAACKRAADRISFRLTYGRTEPRRFIPGTLDGEDVPDAFGENNITGEWHMPIPVVLGAEDTEERWLDEFMGYAVAEAIHEALEWFQVDRAPWLDPHGADQLRIDEAVERFCAELRMIREGPSPPSAEQ